MAPAPFDLHLGHSRDDFAVMGMHFKLGLYEHQSAGTQGVIDLVSKAPDLLQGPPASVKEDHDRRTSPRSASSATR